jgi:hypothetical protein
MPDCRILVFATCSIVLAIPAFGENFYVDPVGGSSSGNGSAAAPWKTLEQVVDDGKLGTTVGPGDTVFLRSGYHGDMDLSDLQNSSPIAIVAQGAHTPQFRRVRMSDTSNWVIRGIHVSGSFAPSYTKETLVELDADTSDVVFEDNNLFSYPDSSEWSASQWGELAPKGISVKGDRNTIRGNQLTNVSHAMSAGYSANDNLFSYNRVTNYSQDGIRGLGDYNTFEYNVIEESYDVDDNHDDAFQSWSRGSDGKVGTGVVRGVILRGNQFIHYRDPDRPLIGGLQGIGCFDGTYEGWIVENNLVFTDHYHGMTFKGMQDSVIINNTVLDPENKKAWISVTADKDGTPSKDVLVRNNLATDFRMSGGGSTMDANLEISSPFDHFVNFAGRDFHLVESSAAIDMGITDQAPGEDLERTSRPQGSGIDLGAFEYSPGGVAPLSEPGRPIMLD